MKLKFVFLGIVAASLSVTAAVAAPSPGKGRPVTSSAACKPKVTVVLKGTVESASATALSLNVTRGNRWGRAYVQAAQPTPVTVDPTTTKVRRNGNKALAADLQEKDRVLVQARVCKADLADDATPPLTAARVVAHPAKA
jgi:hypothetical protein